MGPMTSTADTISRLWIAARALFVRLRAAVGETAALAALDAEDVRDIRLWLRTLEAMVRRIVLIEAIALVRRGDATDARGRSDGRHGARPPAVTLIALPPPSVRFLSQDAAPADAPRPRRAPALRLWPRSPASAGPRVRDPGQPLFVREALADRARLAASRHMQNLRAMRRPEPARIVERIAALARIFKRPLAAVRRLARKLRALPKLALQLAAKRLPRNMHCLASEYAESGVVAFNDAYDFAMDSS